MVSIEIAADGLLESQGGVWGIRGGPKIKPVVPSKLWIGTEFLCWCL